MTQVQIDPDAFALYKRPDKIYPAKVKGTFRNLKWKFMVILLGLYYIMPWVRWDRGPNAPDQAILVDVIHRKFYFFFIEIWPQEVYYFTGLLLLAAMGLFFATTLFGRVWCGYACPQTVWTDLFVAVERWIEGDRNARLKLDNAPLSLSKIRKKVTKHLLWILIGLCTGGAWIFYFNDAPTTWHSFLNGNFPFVPTFWLLFLTMSTYIMAGWARAQICTYVCPYARFQGAMFDQDSLIVAYDAERGEPRGHNKTETSGDCVDCLRCVAVCPMGIDIRDGQQYQCINCALCVDACNAVMDKLDKPRGLIRYNTLNNAIPSGSLKWWQVAKYANLVRFRTILYATVISIVGCTMLFTLITRPMMDINVVRHRNPLYITLSDGTVRNTFTIHIINKTWKDQTYKLSVVGFDHATIHTNLKDQENTVSVGANKVGDFRVFVDVPFSSLKNEGSFPVTITATNTNTKESSSYTSMLVLPEKPF